jgi:hypothetical protein
LRDENQNHNQKEMFLIILRAGKLFQVVDQIILNIRISVPPQKQLKSNSERDASDVGQSPFLSCSPMNSIPDVDYQKSIQRDYSI